MFLLILKLHFTIICFPKTRLNALSVDNSNYKLPNYVSIHSRRTHEKGGGVPIHIDKNFKFKIRKDLNVNC